MEVLYHKGPFFGGILEFPLTIRFYGCEWVWALWVEAVSYDGFTHANGDSTQNGHDLKDTEQSNNPSKGDPANNKALPTSPCRDLLTMYWGGYPVTPTLAWDSSSPTRPGGSPRRGYHQQHVIHGDLRVNFLGAE